jgi:Spy/CpxP family protein refolding chaperone
MSQRQIDANRINGAKGGPRTFAGKQISSMNSLRHGLTAKRLVLTTEEKPHFQEMMDEYEEKFQPQDIEEKDLVREIVAGRWLQERYWSLQTAVMELSMVEIKAEIEQRFDDMDPMARPAYALVQQHGYFKALDMVTKVEGRMRRLHQTARRDLERVQAARTPKESKPAPAAKPPALPVRPQAQPETIPDTPISYRSLLSEEEKARIDANRSEPKFDLGLPEFMPDEDPNAA